MTACLLCEAAPRLDGHLTCGALLCNERVARDVAQLRVGSRAIAALRTGLCDIGERGVCYEVYDLGARQGYAFIFASGRYDGFSPGEAAMMLTITGAVCESVADYRFANVSCLSADFERGLFAPAFIAPAGEGCALCGATLTEAGLLIRCSACRARVMCERHIGAFVGVRRPVCALCARRPEG